MTRGATRRALGTVFGGLRELFAVRWIRWASVLLLLALTVRVGLEQLLATTLNRLAAERGLVCEWEDLELSLLAGRGEIRAFEIRPIPEQEGDSPTPLLDVEYALFDLNVGALLRGELSIARAEVDGLDSWWIREPTGEWNVGHHVSVAEILALTESQPAAEEEEQDSGPEPLDLSPPLGIEALRFQQARYRIVDRMVDPPTELVFEVNAGLSYLNDAQRPARFSVTLLGGALVDAAHIEGSATWTADEIALELRAQAGSIRPRVLARYLEPLDILPVAESLETNLVASLRIAVTGEARDTLQAHAELSEIHLNADGVESLALDRLRIELDSLSSRGATLPSIEVEGIRGRASLESDASLRIAGLDFRGTRWLDSLSVASPSSSPGTSPEEEETGPPAWLSLLLEQDPEAYSWSLGSLDVRSGLLDFTDRTVEPEASFPLYIDSVSVGEVVHAPGLESHTIPIGAGLRVPGLAESIEIKGSIGPFAPKRSIDLDLQVDGLVLTSLEGRMQRMGIERNLERGSFHTRLSGEAETDTSGRTTGYLELDRIALEDGANLFGIQKISASELLFDPAQRLLRFGDLEISGTQLALGRDPSQRFFALGLRTLGFAPEGDSALLEGSEDPRSEPADEAPASTSPQVPTRIELGHFAWVNSDVEFVDQVADPPRRFSFDELGFELTNLTLGGDPDGPAFEPARFSARAVAPQLFDELTLVGSVHTRPGPLDLSVELELRGKGGQGKLARPYLRALGVEPVFTNAIVALDLQASLKQAPAGWLVGASMSAATLHDGETLLLSCDELRVDDLRIGPEIEVGAIAVVAPTARVRRDENGELVLAGVRLVSSAKEPPAVVGEVEAAPLRLPTLPAFRAHQISLEDARLYWNDAAFAPELATEFVLDAALHDLSTDATAGTYEVRLHVPETLERLDLQGGFAIGPDELSLTANVAGEGIRPGPLTRMLPEGIELESSLGRLRGAFEARVEPAEAGGLQASVAARDCAWGEADAEPWLALSAAHLFAPRIDPAAGVLALGPITAQGATIEIVRDAEGTLHLLGLALSGTPAASLPETEETAEEAEVPSSPLVLPRIELVEDVSLQLERLRFRDASLGPEAQPLELGVGLRIETPLVAVSAEPAQLDPIRWHVEGSVAGIVEHWSLSGQVAPFAAEPRLEAVFEATGVRTAGVVERAPQLADQLEGEVEEGTLAASMQGTLFVRRTRPTDLGLSHPFSGELTIEGVEYRDRPQGTILAGVDQVTADVKRVDPDKGLVHVDTIEILRPRGVLRRKDMTLHALGFAVHLDAGGSDPEAQDEAQPEVHEEPSAIPPVMPVEAVVPLANATAAPTSEVRIDQLVVSGLDFELLDETAEPALRVPLTQLDVEVKRFTTRALVEKRPLHFSSYLTSSPEDPGAVVFEEVALAGRVSLYPEPSGWAQLSLTGLELPKLASLAATEGLELEDGAMDVSVRVRLKGEQGANVDSTLVFTDLSMSEPEGGFFETTLSLPMGLDSALFLLKNADGEHRFSTDFDVDEEGISGTQIASAATRAFAEVLARALAAVPLRLFGALIPGGEEEQASARETWTLAFTPGATEPGLALTPDLRAARTALESKRSSVLVLRHELAAADAAYAEQLANPSDGTCLELVHGLRQRKSELLRARDRAAIEAQALYAIGDGRALEAGELLRSQEQELASIEDTIDKLLEILRSDSDRMRLKRTRSTAREIAELRLESVRALLLRNLQGSARERVEVRAPRFEIVPGEGGGRVVVELRER